MLMTNSMLSSLDSNFLADRTIGRAFVTACRLSVCRLWPFVSRQNGWTDLHEIFREGVDWPWDDLITFWVNSEKPRDAAILISLSATLRENGLFWQNRWTDLHAIFREAVEWPRDDHITFWVNSEKPRDAATLISLSATLRENGWTDLHEIFRECVEWPWDDLIQFWVNSDKRVGGSKVNFLLSPAIAQRTGINKSVAFAM